MILVVGGTGMVGSMVAEQLLAQGRSVRILVRPGTDNAALSAAGAQPVLGDMKDPASLAAACDGVETVVTTANSASRGGEDTVETVDLAGNRALIDAAEQAGVRGFVFVSALGASADSPIPFLRAKAATEQRLRESALRWTVLAPTIFTQVWAGMVVGLPVQRNRPVKLIGSGTRRHSFISARDVAAFAVAVIGREEAVQQVLPLGGPEALTWPDVVRVYEKVLGRAIEVRTVAPGDPTPDLPPFIAGMLAAQDTYDSALDTRPLAETYGVELTPVESVVRNQLAGA
jgi:uncharacterized protein YbjT (DUF2867 family)